jgi:hypothetical protein
LLFGEAPDVGALFGGFKMPSDRQVDRELYRQLDRLVWFTAEEVGRNRQREFVSGKRVSERFAF